MAKLAITLGTEPIGCVATGELHGSGGALVFLNGNLLGLHRQPHALVAAMRSVRLWRLGRLGRLGT